MTQSYSYMTYIHIYTHTHTHTHTHIIFLIFHHVLSQVIRYSFLCYMAEPHCLSILNVILHLLTPNLQSHFFFKQKHKGSYQFEVSGVITDFVANFSVKRDFSDWRGIEKHCGRVIETKLNEVIVGLSLNVSSIEALKN